MRNISIYFIVFLMLLLAYLLSVAARMLGLPRVVGQITAGFVLGLPFIQPVFFTPENGQIFSFLAQLGILLLFFFIGLEIDLKRFREHAAESVTISFFNTLFPLVIGYGVALYFGFSSLVALLIGISLSVSSAAIALDILEEQHILRSKLGNLVISTGTIDDLFELILISILLMFFHVSLAAATPLSFVLRIFAFILIIFIFKIWFIPFALHVFEQEKSRSYLFMGAFIIVLLMAWLSEFLGVSALIGAFIAGMLVRYTLHAGKKRRVWEEHEISRSVHILSFGFFIPIFFVWVGVNTQLVAFFEQTPLILPFLLIDIVGTVGGTMLGMKLLGKSWREGYALGWGVIPKGDTELIIATLALEGGLIDKKVFTLIVFIAFLATIIGPIMFKYCLKRGDHEASSE